VSDLREIIALREELEQVKRENSEILAGLFSEKELNKRDLEQQAKGADDLNHHILSYKGYDFDDNGRVPFEQIGKVVIEFLKKQASEAVKQASEAVDD
jgi:hypothetical protein